VSKGEVIARLADLDLRAELRKMDAEIEEKQAKLRLLRAGPRPEEVTLAQASVDKAAQRLKYAKNQLQRLNALYSQQLVSRKDLDEGEEELAVRQKELDEAEGKLRVLLAGSRPEEIEASEAELSRLKAQHAHLDEQLHRLTITSPSAGVVATPKLHEKIGRYVEKGDLIAAVYEVEHVTAEIAVSEKEISDVQVGQLVVLKARAFPAQQFQGRVTAIAPTISKASKKDVPLGKTVVVTTRLENPGLQLKPEMTGNAKIYTGQRRISDLITRRLARYVRVEFWSWW
jgi:multidrug resistance efflux pump